MWHTIQSSLPELLAAGFKYTIPLALVSFFWGLLIALFVALIRLSRQNGAFKILKGIAVFYVWLFRSTPLLVQLFIVFFGLPHLVIPGVFPDGVQLKPFTAVVITFSLNTGAYASETIRAAIASVPKGQWEAAEAIGMTRLQVLWRIICPRHCESRCRCWPTHLSVWSRIPRWQLQLRLPKCFRWHSRSRLKTTSRF